MTDKVPVYTGTSGVENVRDSFLKSVILEKMDPDSFDEKDEKQLVENLAGILVFFAALIIISVVCTLINSLVLFFYLF